MTTRPKRKAHMMLVRVNAAETVPAQRVRRAVRDLLSNERYAVVHRGEHFEDHLTAIAVGPAPRGTRLIGRRQP